MINKITDTIAEAVSVVKDGDVVLIGGFGTAGNPNELIDGLIAHGARELLQGDPQPLAAVPDAAPQHDRVRGIPRLLRRHRGRRPSARPGSRSGA